MSLALRPVFPVLIAVAVYFFETACACAQHNGGPAAYPVKPVRMVVPLAPGGGSDIVGRIVAQSLADQWKYAVVVDNRPGAGGTIGNNIVAKSPADGYTLLVSSSTLAIGPALYKNGSSDVVKDFAAVSLLADQPSIMAVHNNVPAKSMPDLIALFKAQPGKYAFGSAGTGTASHLANELFKTSAGVDVLHVPYKSAGLATTGLLSGEVQFMVTNMATALPQVRSGRLKGLAVTSTKRQTAVPDLPTINEAGLPGFEYTTWYGMLAPSGTAGWVIARIHGDLAALAREPKIQQRFTAQGLDARFTTPVEFDAYLK
ncbi:MAG TPA: tripartite tricarboxylate transporter substrate binding protein, partial [Burkholderiales bacterium]|nr:tripartite tricarboxylate transporter substrate binding protein [Burkholderiales bacterium]